MEVTNRLASDLSTVQFSVGAEQQVDDESVDVGDSVVVDEVQLLVLEALDCRESLFHDAGDCLVLGRFDLQ